MSLKTNKNIAASVHRRLLNLSENQGEHFQLLSIRFATERFLYRLSNSPYADQFILKGAMLFAVWSEDPYRSTRDVDFLLSGDPDGEAVRKIIQLIIKQPVEQDGILFDESSIRIQGIRKTEIDTGLRIRMKSYLGKMMIPLQLDLGFGDVVTPAPVSVVFPTLLDFPALRLRAYSPASVVAEKVQAIVAIGIANSRMKDYYDLWIILKRFPIKSEELSDAIRATFQRRQTEIPQQTPIGLSDEFTGNSLKQKQWIGFLKRHNIRDVPEDLSVISNVLCKRLMPVFTCLIKQTE